MFLRLPPAEPLSMRQNVYDRDSMQNLFMFYFTLKRVVQINNIDCFLQCQSQSRNIAAMIKHRAYFRISYSSLTNRPHRGIPRQKQHSMMSLLEALLEWWRSIRFPYHELPLSMQTCPKLHLPYTVFHWEGWPGMEAVPPTFHTKSLPHSTSHILACSLKHI